MAAYQFIPDNYDNYTPNNIGCHFTKTKGKVTNLILYFCQVKDGKLIKRSFTLTRNKLNDIKYTPGYQVIYLQYPGSKDSKKEVIYEGLNCSYHSDKVNNALKGLVEYLNGLEHQMGYVRCGNYC